MPKINNANVTMTDEGYRNSYKRALEKNRKNATSRPRNIDYPSSRTRHPVEGNVAPIESAPIGRNIYQNGNKYNIAQEVNDNERHAERNEAIAKAGVGYWNLEDPYGSYQHYLMTGKKK